MSIIYLQSIQKRKKFDKISLGRLYMNRGDTANISLDISIDDTSITEGYADDIEVTFNPNQSPYCVTKSLKNGGIVWDTENETYVMRLAQSDTFKLRTGENGWQVRLLIGDDVISSDIQTIEIGPANSANVL